MGAPVALLVVKPTVIVFVVYDVVQRVDNAFHAVSCVSVSHSVRPSK